MRNEHDGKPFLRFAHICSGLIIYLRTIFAIFGLSRNSRWFALKGKTVICRNSLWYPQNSIFSKGTVSAVICKAEKILWHPKIHNGKFHEVISIMGFLCVVSGRKVALTEIRFSVLLFFWHVLFGVKNRWSEYGFWQPQFSIMKAAVVGSATHPTFCGAKWELNGEVSQVSDCKEYCQVLILPHHGHLWKNARDVGILVRQGTG